MASAESKGVELPPIFSTAKDEAPKARALRRPKGWIAEFSGIRDGAIVRVWTGDTYYPTAAAARAAALTSQGEGE